MKDYKNYTKIRILQRKNNLINFKGIEGLAKIKEIITYFRENDIKEFNNTKSCRLKDYQKV